MKNVMHRPWNPANDRLVADYRNGYRPSGLDYEEYLIHELQALGFAAAGTRRTGDQGADIVVEVHPGYKLVIQCKYYAKLCIGNTAVQEVASARAVYQAQAAVVVTNADCTAGCLEAARANDVGIVHSFDIGDDITGELGKMRLVPQAVAFALGSAAMDRSVFLGNVNAALTDSLPLDMAVIQDGVQTSQAESLLRWLSESLDCRGGSIPPDINSVLETMAYLYGKLCFLLRKLNSLTGQSYALSEKTWLLTKAFESHYRFPELESIANDGLSVLERIAGYVAYHELDERKLALQAYRRVYA